MIQAVSDDMSEEEVERVASTVGWTVGPGSCQMVLARRFGGETIQACLVHPRIGGCEVGETAWRPPGRRFLHHVAAGGLGLFVGTATAYQYDVALTFSRALRRRFPGLDGRGAEIERAVHELVANALVHGNLEVGSPAAELDGFDAYCKALDAALADSGKLERQVEISAARDGEWVEIVVTDQGPGFEPDAPIPAPASPRQRGLSIVAAVGGLSFEDGGRCAVLRVPAGAP